MALDHTSLRTAWVCIDITCDGIFSVCSACQFVQLYAEEHLVAAHLETDHIPAILRFDLLLSRDENEQWVTPWVQQIQLCGVDPTKHFDSVVRDIDKDIVKSYEELEEKQEWPIGWISDTFSA